jgi:hypothetical protein
MALVALALMVVLSFGSKTSTASAAETVTICHAGTTLTIQVSQISIYFKGGTPVTAGDYMGPCKTPTKATTSNAGSTPGAGATTQQTTTQQTGTQQQAPAIQQSPTPPVQTERNTRQDESSRRNGGNDSRSSREGTSGSTTNAAPTATAPVASASAVPSATVVTSQNSNSTANNSTAAERLAAIINGGGGNQQRNSAPPPATIEVQASPVVTAEARVDATSTQQTQSVQNLNVSGNNENRSSGAEGRRGGPPCDNNNIPAVALQGRCDENVGGNNPCDNNEFRSAN